MSKALAWQVHLDKAKYALADLSGALGALVSFRNEAVAEVAAFGKSLGVEVNLEAVRALIARPYTLVPTSDPNEWYLVLSRIVNAPAVGWIVSQNEAFTVSRITRTMNVLSPLPAWVRAETNWAEPEHAARISNDHATVIVTRGDRETFLQRYGQFLSKSTADGFEIKKTGKGWIGFVVQMVKDGILPHTPKPVADEDWDDDAKCNITPRDYQLAAIETFRRNGAVSMIAPMGAGKMYTLGYIAAHVRGDSLILAPGSALVDAWKKFFATYAPSERVQVATYQWALAHLKELQKRHFSFLGMDELHRIPANDFSQLAYLPADYRAGATGTPWREDDRTPLIVALAGPPASIPWNELIERGVLLRPRVAAEIVNSDADKVREIKRLLDHHRNSRALIFCDSIQKGKDLARTLDLPFVHGETKNQLDVIKASPHCIVSRVGDYGLDLTDLTLVVEYDYLGKSRVQSAQRMGRLTHSRKSGEHITLFTPEEYHQFGDRLLGIRSELGDIEIIDLTGNHARPRTTIEARPRRASVPRIASAKKPTAVETQSGEPQDEIAAVLAMRPIAVKLADAKKSIGARTAPYCEMVFRYCFKAAFSPRDIADGRGITDTATRSRIQSACKAMVTCGLLVNADSGRYRANQEEIERARVLSAAMR